jgi:hypothetical protein
MNFQELFSPPIGNHKELNPKLWQRQQLRSEVRGALLRIASDFKEFVAIPFPVSDIVITGGNVGFDYTTHSDIDLHLITDYSEISCDREAEELFDTKRILYKKRFKLDIHGIPVELYVEDLDRPAVSAGVYSVVNDQWIKHPTLTPEPKYDKAEVKHWAQVWRTILQHAIKTGDLQNCRQAWRLLKTYRRMGLNTAQAEYSTPNLVYKSLRNDSTIEAMSLLIDRLHDQDLSVY